MHTGAPQDLRGHTCLAPGGVVDALAAPVFQCGLDEGALQRRNVLVAIIGCKSTLNDLALLNEMQALQRIGIAQAVLDFVQLTRQGLAARPTPATRAAALESFEIATNGKTLRTPSSESCLVLDSHNGALPGWSP